MLNFGEALENGCSALIPLAVTYFIVMRERHPTPRVDNYTMDSNAAPSPLCLILLHQVLDLLRDSGANAVEQMGVLQAASALTPVIKYAAAPGPALEWAEKGETRAFLSYDPDAT